MSIKLVDVRKSNNANASVSKSGYNLTTDGREYYIAVFQDSNNPFASLKSRVISQQFDSLGNSVWKAADPHSIKSYLGKELAGSFITGKVEAYKIGERFVDTYTCVVLGHENVETVFRNSGHSLVDTTTGEDKVAVSNVVEHLAKTESIKD